MRIISRFIIITFISLFWLIAILDHVRIEFLMSLFRSLF